MFEFVAFQSKRKGHRKRWGTAKAQFCATNGSTITDLVFGKHVALIGLGYVPVLCDHKSRLLASYPITFCASILIR